jgi:hypothetical protein
MTKHFIPALLLLLFTCKTVAQNPLVRVEHSETYELANVILALTDYGIADETEVQKGTPYYGVVMDFFKPMLSHPLLKAVNYSREKWADYLSFRTDAYAFEFDAQGKIRRKFKFHANDGHRPFDEHLALIQDFAEKSKFRQFYENHRSYYDEIEQRYLSYNMVKEMQTFLIQEFGKFEANTKSLIVVSPLVGRMNCHRDLPGNVAADFANLGMALITGNRTDEVSRAEQATDIHMLFTEMDHGYVNPISDKYAKQLEQQFNHERWDSGSGYTGADCFNEYMTWAVYDLFTQRYFPEVADSINRNWHYQNSNRGFVASSLFGKKLRDLYANKRTTERVKDLYPKILAWTAAIQDSIRVPKLLRDTISVSVNNAYAPLNIDFSEPLYKMDALDLVLFQVLDGERKVLKTLTLQRGQLLFFQGNRLRLTLLDLPKEKGLYGFTLNWWGRKHELTSTFGIPAPSPTRVYVRLE